MGPSLSVLILLFTLINHIHHVTHINYFNYVNHVTNFVPRSLNGNQIKEKEGGEPSPYPPPRADFDYIPPFFCCKVRTTRADLD